MEDELECTYDTQPPKWDVFDLYIWKFRSERRGGGWPYLYRFKDSWVVYHKDQIKREASTHGFPAELLAGVCYVEVGGDPHIIDTLGLIGRAFDYSGPDWVDENMTITNRPYRTSFGSVSMQLATAANTLGKDATTMSYSELRSLATCLESDVFNISLVSDHLVEIIQHDNLGSTSSEISMDDVRIIGARYNRGLGLSLESINRNTSYGDFIVEKWDHLSGLLV
ncbi:MAG: hypothetical protein AB8B56_12740 [Crocinitomicaceae bacterium]